MLFIYCIGKERCILKRNYIEVVENILNINQLTVMIDGGFSDTHTVF